MWKKPFLKGFMILTICHFRKGKTVENKRSVVDSGWQEREEWIGVAQGIFRAMKLFCMKM